MTFLQNLGLVDYSLLIGIQSKSPMDLNRPPTATSLAELVSSLKRSSMSISHSAARQKTSPFNLLEVESDNITHCQSSKPNGGGGGGGVASADMQLHLPPPDLVSTATSPAAALDVAMTSSEGGGQHVQNQSSSSNQKRSQNQ